MRISIIAAGTRGDTQPSVVLATELVRRGHHVELAVSPNTLELVHRAGLVGRGFGPDTQASLDSDRSRQALASGRTGEVGRFMLAEVLEAWDEAVDVALATSAGADVVLASILAADITSVATDVLRVPLVNLHFNPVLPNFAHAHPLVSVRRLPRPLAYGAGLLFEQVWWRTLREHANRSRTNHGLDPVKTPLRRRSTSDLLAVQAWDPALTPGLDLGARAPLTGFLGVTPALRSTFGESLPPEVLTWLDAGEPPVFFGFGSMPVTDPERTLATIVEVARRRKVRALVSAGWSRLAELEPDGDDVMLVGAVDHDALLPRCAAAVHHGGAGTTHVSIGAGVPTVVCPVLADQFLWGAQMRRLGLGATLPFARLTTDGLDDALARALRPETRERVGALSARMVSADDAVRQVADLVESAARPTSAARRGPGLAG